MSYDELYKRVNDDILHDNNNSGNRPSGAVVASSDNNNGQTSGQGNAQSSGGHAGDVHQEPVRVVRPEGVGPRHQLGDNGGEWVERPGDMPATQSSTEQGTDGAGNGGVRGGTSSNGSSQLGLEGNAGNANGEGGTGGVRNGGTVSERPDGRTETLREGTSRRLDEGEHKRELGEEKVPYRKQSGNPFDLQSKMPAEQAEVVKKALEKIGDVDEGVTVNEETRLRVSEGGVQERKISKNEVKYTFDIPEDLDKDVSLQIKEGFDKSFADALDVVASDADCKDVEQYAKAQATIISNLPTYDTDDAIFGKVTGVVTGFNKALGALKNVERLYKNLGNPLFNEVVSAKDRALINRAYAKRLAEVAVYRREIGIRHQRASKLLDKNGITFATKKVSIDTLERIFNDFNKDEEVGKI